jgi:hypothetical protein
MDLNTINGELETLREEVRSNSEKISTNTSDIQANARNLLQEKLEREVAGLQGKFRISGFRWAVKNFGGSDNSVRRKFIKNLLRVAFINQDLMSEEEAYPPGGLVISDCRPLGWKDDCPLEVTFVDRGLWHAIKQKIQGKALLIKIRIMLPKILNAMYDDCLRYRRVLLDGLNTRTLYVDIKPSTPYITLMEKTKVGGKLDRVRVPVVWLDPQFKDPIKFHETYQHQENPDNKRGRGRPQGKGKPKNHAETAVKYVVPLLGGVVDRKTRSQSHRVGDAMETGEPEPELHN